MTDKGDSEIRFIADEMLGRLAKWLRAIGYDTIYYSGGEDSALVQQALEEDRTILTRDSGLLKRKQVRKSLFVKSDQPREQLRQLIDDLDLDVKGKLFTRCTICNRELIPVRKEDIRERIPKYTYLTQNDFYGCPGCGRIYWPGTHRCNMKELIGSIVTGDG